ncbi:MAG TPA: peptidylprolyl isomerase [Chitinophagaceae bacterium]|nr:peptidylprolyl isomerase [Chitinophagaceae bacterium]
MKTLFVGLLLLVMAPVVAQQTVTEKFQKINTRQDAEKFVADNAALKPEIFNRVWGKDSSLIDKRLLRQKQGDIFSVGYVTYKVLESKESIAYRANYIFLDGGTLNPREIDSMKKLIVQQIAAGANWNELSNKYTMDGNKTFGDTGWFFGPEMLPAEFQDAVAKHKTGEVFFVDVPEKQWHYIVKKTYDDQVKKEITVLKANGR